MALDLSFTCVDGVAAEQSNFTVVFEPANPVEGEMVHMHITGNGGHTGVPAIETDPDLIGVVWDFDDAGNTWIGDGNFLPLVKGRAQQPELGYTHITAHRWKTAGVKTVEISSFTAGGGLRVQTFQVTVASVDSLTLTKDLYIDLTGSTAGMPAEDSVVTRITSYAAIAALSGSFGASDVVRWRFRAGTTHQLDASGSGTIISLEGALQYVGSFGSGTRPIVQENAPAYAEQSLFSIDDADLKLIIHGVDFDGRYDTINGYFRGSRMTVAKAAQPGITISMTDSLSRGVDIALRGSGSADTNTANYGFVGCTVLYSQDFGVFTAWANCVSTRGCLFRSPIISSRGDDKGTDQSDFADHGFFRCDGAKCLAVTDNHIDPNGGWSGHGTEKYLQSVRTHLNRSSNAGSCYASVSFNTIRGGNLVGIGEHSPNASSETAYPNYTLVACNDYTMTPNGGPEVIINRNAGGVFAYGNVVYQTASGGPSATRDFVFFEMTDQRATIDAIWRTPCRIRYNTVVSDKETTAQGQFWGADTGDLLEYTIDTLNGADLTIDHNLLASANHQNAGSLLSPGDFSRGDYFRPITGGDAVTSTTDDIPPFNFDGTRNGAGVTSTIDGAHRVAGASVAVTPPSWASAPTIAFLDAYGGDVVMGVTGVSGLSGDDWIALELNWLVDGVIERSSSSDRRWNHSTIFVKAGFTDPNITGTVVGYPSGTTIQAHVYATNRAGGRVQGVSNVVTVP